MPESQELTALAPTVASSPTLASSTTATDSVKVILWKRSGDGSQWDRLEKCVHDLCAELALPPGAQTTTGAIQAFAYLEIKDLNELLRTELSKTFSIPDLFWEVMYERSNGFFRSEELFDAKNEFNGLITWLKVQVKHVFKKDEKTKIPKYEWDEIMLFSKIVNNSYGVMLHFDTDKDDKKDQPKTKPTRFQQKLEKMLRTSVEASRQPLPNPTIPYHLYGWHALVFEQVLALYDESVWALRDQIRPFEKARIENLETPKTTILPWKKKLIEPNFELLHDIGRHTTHSTETLSAAIGVVELMLAHCRSVLEIGSSGFSGPDRNLREHRKTTQTMEAQVVKLKSLKERSQANEARLQAEINLSFNLVSQADTSATVVLSQVAFIFLPATFICGIFSTTFFAYVSRTPSDNLKWRMSPLFWLLWVVVVPVTVLAYALRPQTRGGQFFRPRWSELKQWFRKQFRSNNRNEMQTQAGTV